MARNGEISGMRKCQDEIRPCRKCGTPFIGEKCKACAAARTARYRERHPERAKESAKRSRAKHADKVAEYMREYAVANRERLTANAKARRHANPVQYREAARARRQRNPEHYREMDRQRTATPERKEYRKRYTKAYREANADKLLPEKRAWYAANRERLQPRMRETSKQWAKANPEKCRARRLRRIARKKNAPGPHHTADDVRKQYEAQNGRCYWCKKRLGNRYHVDHVIPLARGGSNGPENIVCACPPCNFRKGAQMPEEFAGVLL